MKYFILFSLFLSFSMSGRAQQIDPAESGVNFSVSNFRVRTVEGSLGGMKGNVQFDQENLDQSRFEVSIDVQTINTENNKRDTHLKSEDFFEVATFPTISFASERITKKGDAYLTAGTLTIKDVSKSIEIPFVVREEGNSTILTGTFSLDRKDYHVGEDTSTFMVGNEIEVEISCVVK